MHTILNSVHIFYPNMIDFCTHMQWGKSPIHILYVDWICSLHTTRQVSHLWIVQLALIVWASQYLGHILWSKASSWEVLGSLQYSLQTVKWLLLLGRLPGVLKTRVELGFKRGPAIVQGNQFVWESQMIK